MRMCSGTLRLALAGACALTWTAAASAEVPVRIGVLKFGTVNWEIDTITHNQLDRQNGIDLEVLELASNEATRVALQSGEVDIIVSDWLLVSRLRAEGEPLTFVPYSTSVGSIMVKCDAGIDELPDLAGKTIGIAGGPLDKGWLTIQGLAEGRYGFDLRGETRQVFGAPPLLAEKLRQGELDAALNYWHYNARLETEGYCELVGGQEAAKALGAQGDISAIGYVFNEDWANANKEAALGFVRASKAAKELLAESDAEWERLRPLMGAENEAVFETLIKRYREGIPSRPIVEEERDTAKVYDYLAEEGGEQLVGPAEEMAEGTFWSALKEGT
jgi:NitT/TauT family transport system substrate-binding protein